MTAIIQTIQAEKAQEKVAEERKGETAQLRKMNTEDCDKNTEVCFCQEMVSFLED